MFGLKYKPIGSSYQSHGALLSESRLCCVECPSDEVYMEPIFHLIFKLVHSIQSSVNICLYLRLSPKYVSVCSPWAKWLFLMFSMSCSIYVYTQPVYTSLILNRIHSISMHCSRWWGVSKTLIFSLLYEMLKRMLLNARHLQIETQNHLVLLAKVNCCVPPVPFTISQCQEQRGRTENQFRLNKQKSFPQTESSAVLCNLSVSCN